MKKNFRANIRQDFYYDQFNFNTPADNNKYLSLRHC